MKKSDLFIQLPSLEDKSVEGGEENIFWIHVLLNAPP